MEVDDEDDADNKSKGRSRDKDPGLETTSERTGKQMDSM